MSTIKKKEELTMAEDLNAKTIRKKRLTEMSKASG